MAYGWSLDREEATSSLALEISCNFFAVYGLTRPSLGRLFGPDECASASEERVVVLSEEAWRSRFAADPHILGKVILLNRQPFTVIGITRWTLPADSVVLESGCLTLCSIGSPGMRTSFARNERPRCGWKGGCVQAALASNLRRRRCNRRRVPAFDPELKQRVLVTSGALIEDPNVRANSFWILLLIGTGATLLLLVSCASGAVLLLSRAIGRRQEIAVRISLGAAGRRVLRQLLPKTCCWRQ